MKKSIANVDFNNFKQFYSDLHNKKDIIYMYFSINLLHYAFESTSYVPQIVNLVLITSNLSEEEKILVSKYIFRPIVHLNNRYNDGHIWEMLMEVNEENFGWMDVDCFITSPTIFSDIIQINYNDAINTVWARKHDYYGIDQYFANTYMQFLNINIVKKIMKKYPKLNMTPILTNENVTRWYEVPRFMDDEEKTILTAYFPNIVNNTKGFDTTHYYQMLIMMEGYKINRIRELDQLDKYYSEEAIHLGGCNMIHTYLIDKTVRRIYYRFNMRYSYYLLWKYLSVLPVQYQIFRKIFEQTMVDNKLSLDIDDILSKITDYMERNGIMLYVEKECIYEKNYHII